MTLPLVQQQLQTREAFEAWLAKNNIAVPKTARIEPCPCGDVNCHGWRVTR